jgi:hypothetical protein
MLQIGGRSANKCLCTNRHHGGSIDKDDPSAAILEVRLPPRDVQATDNPVVTVAGFLDLRRANGAPRVAA